MNLNNEITRKFGVTIVLSITVLLFFIGILNINHLGLPIPTSLIVALFTIGFVVGTLFSDSRRGVYPWTLVCGLIVAVITTVVITCVVSGIIFTVTGRFKIDIDLLIYSFSTCMIFSVIALNIANNHDIVEKYINNNLCPKKPSDHDLEYYEDHEDLENTNI